MNKETTYRTKTIQVGCVQVTIHQPILSDRERAKAEENIVSALGRYGRAISNDNKN
jgi:hypothetical protein